MSEPTKAQIKEFWERYGFEYKETTKQVCGVVTKCFRWKYPDGSWHDFLPPIDLNNLFKYAVPKAMAILVVANGVDEYEALEIIFAKWLKKFREGYSFSGALFWALREIIKERKRREFSRNESSYARSNKMV